MGKFDGRVALITGGARGQGRSHALALAREGANIAICDIAGQIETVPYPMGTEEGLKETARLVEELGVHCLAVKADCRDTQQVQNFVDTAVSKFGRVDILLANAGICSISSVADMSDQMWDEMIDNNLTGTFKSIRAVLPQMIRQNYGRIVATASMAGRVGFAGLPHYVATKWGILGLVKSLALEVADKGITVNAICPTTADTPMIQNEAMHGLFCPDVPNPTKEDVARSLMKGVTVIPVPWVEVEDVTNAMLYLVSDGARYVTGDTMHVAAGMSANNSC